MRTLISVEDYLQGERHSEVRHEHVDGYVYAMAGASDDYNRIVLNLAAELRAALRGKPCEPFITDMKVRIPQPERLEGLSSVLRFENQGVEIPLERIYERTAAAR